MQPTRKEHARVSVTLSLNPFQLPSSILEKGNRCILPQNFLKMCIRRQYDAMGRQQIHTEAIVHTV